jgi:hypothetical protein
MKRSLIALIIVASSAWTQDEGRDTGREGKPVLFVRWRRLPETGEIYRAAWRALEPYFGVLSRRRILEFDADPDRARRLLKTNADAALVVALDAESATESARHLPDVRRLLVGAGPDATVVARTERKDLARLIRFLRPDARSVALFGPKQKLPGFAVTPCTKPEQAKGHDVAWIAEGSRIDARALRRVLDALEIPLVSTARTDPNGAALHIRPDPSGLGRRAASQILGLLRDGRKFERGGVRRVRVTLDLDAARASGTPVSLGLLARADVLRRSR